MSPSVKYFNVNTGIIFKGNSQNFQREIFITDFDGYPSNGTVNFGFTVVPSYPLMNQDIYICQYITLVNQATTYYVFLNHLTCTFILLDTYSFLVSPITLNIVSIYANPMR